MPGLWDKISGGLNDARVRARDTIAQRMGMLAGAPSYGGIQSSWAAHPDDVLHKVTSRNLTSKLGTILPPQLAKNTADILGIANEIPTGLLEASEGRPFFSEAGFDIAKDMRNNRIGQDAAALETEAVHPVTKVFRDLSGLSAMEGVSKFLARPETYNYFFGN